MASWICSYSIFFFSSRRRHTRCSRDWSSDVCSSDLGTRTAAITGAFVAAHDAVGWLIAHGTLTASPIRDFVAAVSVGVVGGTPLLDLEIGRASCRERV